MAEKYKQNAEQKRIERIEREMEEEEKILRLNKQKVANDIYIFKAMSSEIVYLLLKNNNMRILEY